MYPKVSSANQLNNCVVTNESHSVWSFYISLVLSMVITVAVFPAYATDCLLGTTEFYTYHYNSRDDAIRACATPFDGSATCTKTEYCVSGHCSMSRYSFSCGFTTAHRYQEVSVYYHYPKTPCPPATDFRQDECRGQDVAPAPVPDKPKKTALLFVNGMFNSFKDARLNMDRLSIAYQEAALEYHEADLFTSKLVYNHDEYGLHQAFEVMRQKLADNAIAEYNLISMLQGRQAMIPSIRDAWLAGFIYLDMSFSDPDLNSAITEIQGAIAGGSRVLLVGHSQGNFYVNRAYERLTDAQKKNVGIVSVATPTSYIAGYGEWTTLTNDVVIQSVRALFPNTLPGNEANSSSFQFFHEDAPRHHGFIPSYLNGDRSGSLIKKQISEILKRMARP